ncbi:MAG: hypothetical protein JWP98_689, partial [Edaphobacter sp.]|nr:hypothetical protein [Edaphobacter sp.]
ITCFVRFHVKPPKPWLALDQTCKRHKNSYLHAKNNPLKGGMLVLPD